MSVDFEDAFGYPVRGDGAIRRFAIGGGVPSLFTLAFLVFGAAAVFLPLLGIPLVLLAPVSFAFGLALTGYYVRVARETYAGSDEPPAFENWVKLVIDGGYCVLIGVVYALPLVLAGVVGVVGFVALVGGGAALGGTEMESAIAALGLVTLLGVLLLAILGMVYGLAVSYLYPISVCIYADTADVRASFSRERLKAVALSEGYALPWVVQAGVMFGIQMIVSMLTMILIGYLLYPFLPFATFFVTTAAFYMYAQAYDERVGAGRTRSDATGQSAVRKGRESGRESGY